jgi:hypothetical protein
MVEDEIDRMRREMKAFTRAIGRKAQEVVREGWYRPMFARWKRNAHLPTLLNTSRKDQTPARSNRGYLVDEQYFGQSLPGLTTTERKKRAFS